MVETFRLSIGISCVISASCGVITTNAQWVGDFSMFAAEIGSPLVYYNVLTTIASMDRMNMATRCFCEGLSYYRGARG